MAKLDDKKTAPPSGDDGRDRSSRELRALQLRERRRGNAPPRESLPTNVISVPPARVVEPVARSPQAEPTSASEPSAITSEPKGASDALVAAAVASLPVVSPAPAKTTPPVAAGEAMREALRGDRFVFPGSTNVKAATFAAKTGQLEVEFGNGAVHRYGGFTSEKFAAWKSASSAGKWFSENIRKMPDKHPDLGATTVEARSKASAAKG